MVTVTVETLVVVLSMFCGMSRSQLLEGLGTHMEEKEEQSAGGLGSQEGAWPGASCASLHSLPPSLEEHAPSIPYPFITLQRTHSSIYPYRLQILAHQHSLWFVLTSMFPRLWETPYYLLQWYLEMGGALEATSSAESRIWGLLWFSLLTQLHLFQPTFLQILADWQGKKGEEEGEEGKTEKIGLLVSWGWVLMVSQPV